MAHGSRPGWMAPSGPSIANFREAEGRQYVIEVPYAEARELSTEILKFGADVEVLSTRRVPERVRDALRQAAKRYGDGTEPRNRSGLRRRRPMLRQPADSAHVVSILLAPTTQEPCRRAARGPSAWAGTRRRPCRRPRDERTRRTR